MTLLRVSDVAEAALNKWAVALMAGEIRLWELPPSVSQFVHIGWGNGCADRQPEVDELERQVNRFHNLAFEKDPDRRARLEARLSQALQVAPEAQWEQLERDLRAMVTQRSEDAAEAVVEEQQNGRSGRDRADTLPHKGQRNQERAA